MNDVVEVQVRNANGQWLTAARTWTTEPSEALVLTFRRVPTNRDLIVIEQLAHTLAGGFRAWVDLRQSERTLYEVLYIAYERQLWPDGRPPTKTDKEAAEQQQAINVAFMTDSSTEADGLRHMRELSARIWFMASWVPLIVGAPPGWAVVADLPDSPPGILDLLRAAHAEAVSQSETTEGN